MKYMNKRGLSDIIATVLIVLLALAAVAIVWSVVSSMIGDTSAEITLTNLCVQSEARVTSCTTSNTNKNINVQLVRGDDVSAVRSVLFFTDGSSAKSPKVEGPIVQATNLTVVPLDSKTADYAQAIVVVKDPDSGTEKECTPLPAQYTC